MKDKPKEVSLIALGAIAHIPYAEYDRLKQVEKLAGELASAWLQYSSGNQKLSLDARMPYQMNALARELKSQIGKGA